MIGRLSGAQKNIAGGLGCRPDLEESLQRARKCKQRAELMLDNFKIFIESTDGEYFGEDTDKFIYQIMGKMTALIWEYEKEEEYWLKEIDK